MIQLLFKSVACNSSLLMKSCHRPIPVAFSIISRKVYTTKNLQDEKKEEIESKAELEKKRKKEKISLLSVLLKVSELKEAPPSALFYGATGLIPFYFPPLMMLNEKLFMPTMFYFQLNYAALIFCFVGAVRWGFTMSPNSPQKMNFRNITYSIVPALLAGAFYKSHPNAQLLLVLIGLIYYGYSDIKMPGYPAWYKVMRMWLTPLALISLCMSFYMYLAYPDEHFIKLLKSPLLDDDNEFSSSAAQANKTDDGLQSVLASKSHSLITSSSDQPKS